MKQHSISDPRLLVVKALVRVEQESSYSNIVLDHFLRSSELSAPDRKLATRIFYGTLSNLRTIDFMISRVKPDFQKATDPLMRAMFRSAVFQLRYLDRIPDYSILNQSVGIIKGLRGAKAAGFCNAILRKLIPVVREPLPECENAVEQFALEYSLSDYLAQRLVQQFGEENAKKLARSFNEIPSISVRVNFSKTTPAQLRTSLQAEESQIVPTALKLSGWSNELRKAIQAGECCIQDEASQVPVAALGDLSALPHSESEPVIIWDACAGQGGKTIHLLDRFASENVAAKVLATDLYQSKLDRIVDYQKKYFADQKLYVRRMDLEVGGSVTMAPFAAVIVDAPCSGLGVLRRHPEAKWNKSEEDLEALPALQAKILHNCASHVRPGGILIYAVCTFSTEETTAQVARFLEKHPHFVAENLPLPTSVLPEPASSIQLLPSLHGCDGFFVARFRRVS